MKSIPFVSCFLLATAISLNLKAAEPVTFSLVQNPPSTAAYDLKVDPHTHTLYSSLITITYPHAAGSVPGQIDVTTSISGLNLVSNTNASGVIQVALASANGVTGNATLATISFGELNPDSISIATVRVNEGNTPSQIQTTQTMPLSGHVYLWGDSSKPIGNVEVVLTQNGNQQSVTTQSDGGFTFEVSSDEGVQLGASKTANEKVAAGVDVSGIVRMRKHILSRERLPTFLSMIAADPTRDNSIDVSDIVAMRKLILSKTDYFTRDAFDQPQSLWRFFAAAVVNKSTQEALTTAADLESIQLDPASESLSDLVIVGVKLGDTNRDW